MPVRESESFLQGLLSESREHEGRKTRAASARELNVKGEQARSLEGVMQQGRMDVERARTEGDYLQLPAAGLHPSFSAYGDLTPSGTLRIHKSVVNEARQAAERATVREGHVKSAREMAKTLRGANPMKTPPPALSLADQLDAIAEAGGDPTETLKRAAEMATAKPMPVGKDTALVDPNSLATVREAQTSPAPTLEQANTMAAEATKRDGLPRRVQPKLKSDGTFEFLIEVDKPRPQPTDLLTPVEAGALGVPYGTTHGQATGAVSLTAAQRTKMDAQASVLALVDKLEKDIGLSGATAPTDPVGRLWQTPYRLYEIYGQGNPKLAALHTRMEGTLALIVRSLGEVGTLTDQDIERARKLQPVLGPIPDTDAVIQEKISGLRDLVREVASRTGSRLETPAPRSTAPPTTPAQRGGDPASVGVTGTATTPSTKPRATPSPARGEWQLRETATGRVRRYAPDPGETAPPKGYERIN